MTKTWLPVFFILSISFLTFTQISTIQVQSTSSIYCDGDSSIHWIINEPKNTTYSTSTLNLNVTVETFMAGLTNVSYSIDNQTPSILFMKEQKTVDDPLTQSRNGFTLLPSLTNGVHKITVYVDGWTSLPSKNIPTQQTELYFEIKSTAPVQDNPTYGKGATIYSPCNRTYKPNEVIAIKASSPTLGGANIIYQGTYTIDDGTPHNLSTESIQTHSWDPFFGALIGTAILPPLPEGKHKLTVYMKTYIESSAKPPTMAGEATVYFSIGDKEPPSITIYELDGSVYNQTTITLNFTLNEPTSWIAYSLDNSSKITITTNTTLSATAGPHTLVLYASDIEGNMGQTEMAHFTVQATPPIQKVNLTWLVAAVLAAICIAAFLVVYRRRSL